jgi:hypothetical protein
VTSWSDGPDDGEWRPASRAEALGYWLVIGLFSLPWLVALGWLVGR